MLTALTDAIVRLFVRARFRYDIFLSYSRADAARYATSLRDDLAKLDYSCFLDADEAPAGASLSTTLQKALNRSAVLVVVGSHAATQSHYVGQEVAHFSTTKRDVLPINIGGLRDAHWGTFQAADHIWIDETEDALVAGRPSHAVVDAIEKRFRYTRRNVRVRTQIAAAGAAFVLGALLAGVLLQRGVRTADAARQQAQQQQRLAEDATRVANRERADAEQSRAEALRQQQEAERRRNEAEQATAEALRQQVLAESRRIAAQAEQTLIADPTEALSLSLRSYRVAKTDESRAAIAASFPRLLTTLAGHSGNVRSGMFSSDGRSILTASNDGSARLWNAADGRARIVMKPNNASVREASLSHDERRIVTAADDSTARVWDAGSGKELPVLKGHTGAVRAARFSPNDRWIVTTSDDATARVWNADTGQSVAILQAAAEYLASAEFSPGSDRIVSCGDAGVQVWRRDTGQVVAKLGPASKDRVDPSSYATFSHDGRRVVATGGEDVQVWAADTGHRLMTLRAGAVRHFAISFDDRRIVTGGSDRTGRVWDASTGRLLLTLRGHTDAVTRVRFSADGRWIVTASADRTARVWNASTGDLLATLQGHSGPVSDATISEDGLVVTVSDEPIARVWNLAAGDAVVTLRTDGNVWSAAYSPDGRRVSTTTSRNVGEIWDPDTGKRVVTLRGSIPGTAVFFPDGRRILASGGDTAGVWSATTGELLFMLPQPPYSVINGVSISRDGARILTYGVEFGRGDTIAEVGTARVWNAADGREVATLEHPRQVKRAAYSADGQRIVTTTDDSTVTVWSAATGQPLTTPSADGGRSVASPEDSDVPWRDDRILLAAGGMIIRGEGSIVRVSDARTDRIVVVLGDESSRAIGSASFSRDGRRILASSRWEDRIWIYRVLTLTEIADLLKR